MPGACVILTLVMPARVTVTKADPSAVDPAASPKVFRLSDMEVREVSLVDRPANGSTFIVVKRDGLSKDALVQNPDGTFSTATTTEKAPGDAAPPVAQPGPGPGESSTSGAPASSGLALTADQKAGMTEVLGTLGAALDAATKLLDSASVAASPEAANAAPLAEVLASLCETAEDAAMALLGLDTTMSEPPVGSEPAPAEPVSAAAPFGKVLGVRKARRLLGAYKVEQLYKTAIAKVGAKMAKARFDRFKQALNALAEILGELDVEAKADSKDAAAPPPPPAKGKKPAPAAPGAAPAPAASPDAEKAAAMAKRISELESMLASVDVLRKSIVASNTVVPDGASPPPREAPWPSDMTR